jgi:hypothetical protein
MTDNPHPPMRGNAELAWAFLDHHDSEGWFRDPAYDGPCEVLDSAKVDEVADLLLDFIANVVASIIDAGSERDAVNENETLLAELRKELRGWTEQPEETT